VDIKCHLAIYTKIQCWRKAWFVWFNVRKHYNGYKHVGFRERKTAQELRMAYEIKRVYTSCITTQKHDIIKTRDNPATQQISIRVSWLTFLSNVSVFTPRSKYTALILGPKKVMGQAWKNIGQLKIWDLWDTVEGKCALFQTVILHVKHSSRTPSQTSPLATLN
jgi:hypothetical protein